MRCASVMFLAVALALVACGPPGEARSPRSALADKWLTRAKQSYATGDFDDAASAIESALQASPNDAETRVFAAKLALAKLEYAKALKLTEGIQTTEGHGIRGRAHWYAGDLEQAADELEAALQDPTTKDEWARDVAGLARRGVGRHPFAMEGALLAPVDMPRAGPALIVPCELEGERILAMIATASGEVVLDSNSRREPAWVNLRFGDQIEIKDVPALTQDLSGLTRQMGAPIKALLGVNLLRHAHVTFDRHGDQFVVRRNEPPAPPEASRVPLWYVRGGGMLLRTNVNKRDDGGSVFLVDSSQAFPLALDGATWKKAGVDVASLAPEPSAPNVKSGVIPRLTVGGFDLPKIPAIFDNGDLKSRVDLDLGGVIGAGLLSIFRVTFGDEGRFLWLEPDPSMTQPQGPPATPPARSEIAPRARP